MNLNRFMSVSKLILIGIVLMAFIPLANANSSKCTSSSVLYREVSPTERLTKLTPIEQPALLSRHYCVGFYEIDQQIDFKLKDAAAMLKRYYAVGNLLRTDAEKIALAHVFLKQLRQKKLALPRSDIDNQVTIMLLAKTQDGLKAKLNLNLSYSDNDYLVVSNGLYELSLLENDELFLAKMPGIKELAKWILKGEGQNDYFDGYYSNTLLPDDVGGSCPDFDNCQLNYDEIQETSYDWGWYYDIGFSLSLEDGRRWEEEQCSVHNNCIVYEYGNEDYDEACIRVYYPSTDTTIDGLYCEVEDTTP